MTLAQQFRQEGRQEGRQQGMLIGQIRLCQQILKEKPTPESELAGLSLTELEALATRLEARVLGANR